MELSVTFHDLGHNTALSIVGCEREIEWETTKKGCNICSLLVELQSWQDYSAQCWQTWYKEHVMCSRMSIAYISSAAYIMSGHMATLWSHWWGEQEGWKMGSTLGRSIPKKSTMKLSACPKQIPTNEALIQKDLHWDFYSVIWRRRRRIWSLPNSVVLRINNESFHPWQHFWRWF